MLIFKHFFHFSALLFFGPNVSRIRKFIGSIFRLLMTSSRSFLTSVVDQFLFLFSKNFVDKTYFAFA